MAKMTKPKKKTTKVGKKPAAKKPASKSPKAKARKSPGRKKPAVKKVRAVAKKARIVKPPVSRRRVLVKEIKKERVALPPSPSLRLYRRIAVGFIALVGAILILTLFVTTVNVTIKITPTEQPVETEFIVNVLPTGGAEGTIQGLVTTKIIEQSKSFEPQGEEKKQVVGKSGGTITVYNTTSKAQPLVATTRFLSSEGILFRLDDGVFVPANGQIEAVIRADQPGPQGDIDPGRFTIPGLASSLQPVIYGESVEPMSGGVSYVSVITQEDIDSAGEVLQKELLATAKEELRLEAPSGFDGEIFSTKIVEKVSDTLPDVETDAFVISMTLESTGLFYNKSGLENVVGMKLFEQVKKGQELVSVDWDGLQVELLRQDENQSANVKMMVTGSSIISPTHELLAKTGLVGETEEEILSSLVEAGLAETIDVDFFPPWVDTVPSLRDHIKIKIQKN